jgi:glutathione S-transferase
MERCSGRWNATSCNNMLRGNRLPVEGRLELHGLSGCPSVWQVRIAAWEKGVPIDWVPFDTGLDDERVSLRNAERRSPRLVHGALVLDAGPVIQHYLDEVFSGRSLQCADPRTAVRLRLAASQLADLHIDGWAEPSAATRRNVVRAYEVLEALLGGGGEWLGGDEPCLVDFDVWTSIALLSTKELGAPKQRARIVRYWQRARERPSFANTRPSWFGGAIHPRIRGDPCDTHTPPVIFQDRER